MQIASHAARSVPLPPFGSNPTIITPSQSFYYTLLKCPIAFVPAGEWTMFSMRFFLFRPPRPLLPRWRTLLSSHPVRTHLNDCSPAPSFLQFLLARLPKMPAASLPLASTIDCIHYRC